MAEQSRKLAARIAEASPLTVALGKQAFYTQIDLDQPKAYAYAKEVMTMNALAADAQEGISAFLEKRRACWTGSRAQFTESPLAGYAALAIVDHRWSLTFWTRIFSLFLPWMGLQQAFRFSLHSFPSTGPVPQEFQKVIRICSLGALYPSVRVAGYFEVWSNALDRNPAGQQSQATFRPLSSAEIGPPVPPGALIS